jgi:diaminopimelate epimerase
MTQFFKLSGGGNDFLALAEPDPANTANAEDAAPPPERIRAWCRRGISLGADGLFILRRTATNAEMVAMDYFNADGFPADLCLNGTRCAAQLAFHLGWTTGSVEIQTGAGPVSARRIDAERVRLALPAPAAPTPLSVDVDGTTCAGHRVQVGVPHFVMQWDDLERAPVQVLGAALRHHAVFAPGGTNVNFVHFVEKHRLEIRTFERGVEDETLACGSGVLASTAVGLALGALEMPVRVLTQGGFELDVDLDSEHGRWFLGGDARVVAEGKLLPSAAVEPSPPAWS